MNLDVVHTLWKKRALSRKDCDYIQQTADTLKHTRERWDLLHIDTNTHIAEYPLSHFLTRLKVLSVSARIQEDVFSWALYGFLASESVRDIRRFFRYVEPFLVQLNDEDVPDIYALIGYYLHHQEQWALLNRMWTTVSAERCFHQLGECVIHSIQCMYFLLNTHLQHRTFASLLDSSEFFDSTRKYFVWTELFSIYNNPFTTVIKYFNIDHIMHSNLAFLHRYNERYFMVIRSFLFYLHDLNMPSVSCQLLHEHFKKQPLLYSEYINLIVTNIGDDIAQDFLYTLGYHHFMVSDENMLLEESTVYID